MAPQKSHEPIETNASKKDTSARVKRMQTNVLNE